MTIQISALPTETRKEIKEGIDRLLDSLTRIQEERDFQKETLEELEHKHGVDKKLVRKIARALFKASFYGDKQSNEEFEEAYETLITPGE